MSVREPSRGGVVVGMILAILAVWGVIEASAWSYRPPEADRGVLRLSWRISAEGGEVCRPATEEELAELPVHMRTDEVCESIPAGFDLTVTVDGDTLAAERLQGRGARGDRPISLLREWSLAPGSYRIGVLFESIIPEGPVLEIDRTVQIVAGEVILVSIHPETGGMVVTE